MTARQFYITLAIILISLKVQKIPSIMYGKMGKDFYLLILAYLLVNIFLICIVFFILNKEKKYKINLNQLNQKNVLWEIIYKIFMIFIAIYFSLQALLLYDHIQALFANALFENFSWTIFSVLFLFTVFYLSHNGLKNIAYNVELYFFIIAFSMLILTILGVAHTNFLSVLPLSTIKLPDILSNYISFNLWFGDYFVIFFLARSAKNIKLSKTILTYSLTMVFVIFLYIVFEGIYQDYTPIQASLIGAISEQSMLGIGIGRFDWFFILFAELGAILSCALCIFFARKSFSCVIKTKNKLFIEVVFAVVFYFVDVFILNDFRKKEVFFTGIAGELGLAVRVFVIVSIFIFVVFKSIKKTKVEEVSYEA